MDATIENYANSFKGDWMKALVILYFSILWMIA
jgi:hypothetical protein